MNRFPAASATALSGVLKTALVAGPPLPLEPVIPIPATVDITPVELSTLRIRSTKESATRRFCALSSAIPSCLERRPLTATPPSPPAPPPENVLMLPVAKSTFRILLLLVSAMYTFPAVSTATPCSALSCALVATPPSPLNPLVFTPATVLIDCVAASTRRIR